MSLLLDLIFPKTCYGCGQSGSYLCPECQKKITPLPLIHTTAIRPLSGLLTVFPYHSPVGACLHGLKYDLVTDTTEKLTDITAAAIKTDYPRLLTYWQDHRYQIVPLPLHPSRQNFRGFNQSTLLGQLLSAKLKLTIIDNLLFRIKNTLSQAKIKHANLRCQNLLHAFSLNPKIVLPRNPRLILFDDVVTSTSTILSAANTISILKPRDLWGLSIAGPNPASAHFRR